MLKKGLIEVYTGTSEQINFAPFGLAVRASGHKFRTLITCFEPHELLDGAIRASSFLDTMFIDHSDIGKAPEAFQKARQAALAGDYDIVVLSHIIPLINQGIIGLDHVLSLMEKKSENVELVLSGSGAPQDIIEKADLVTEMVVSGPEEMVSENKGTIEVITGNGKGKTTYCFGRAVLESSLGTRSSIVQFIKSPKSYGEVKATRKLPNLEIMSMGEGFLDFDSNGPKKKHIDAAGRAWEECLKEVFSLKYGLIVLDEIDNATYYGLVNPERVREMLFLKPRNLHLLLSGRNAHSKVMAAATTVIEMKEIKHPFNKGIKARKGIEF
ncbi:MAG: cob(I)yrinic acid a,c-diamide adenosyltransferase [Deltaproteobacteria bacterium]|nr:cob(I)yrinic acid a,c-diamide adenosyltransferase [Deltaproteobacteria bacterium]MBW2342607.1 cob(I)yrinic acid a,c-diamide adenosyltransferase [Deltaproteobacteria bacterium]